MALAVECRGLEFTITDGEFTGRQSSIVEYIECHRLFGWGRVEHLEPEKIRWPLEFGSAMHIYLQERARGVDQKTAVRLAETRLFEKMPKAIVPGEEEDAEKHRDMLYNLSAAYDTEYENDSERFIPLGNEIKGRVPVGPPEARCFLVFKTDKIVNYQNQLWLIDHKTMGKNDDREFMKYEMDFQITAYTYGVSKVLGTRVAGVIIDGLIKTKVPQFRREIYLRSDEELAEWETEFVEICSEIASRLVRVQNGEDWKTVFYKNTKHCFRYSACPFRQLCMRDTPVMRLQYRKRAPDYMDDPRLLEKA